MTSKFSAALKLGDLNDFIAPSQACVVSLSGSKEKAVKLNNGMVEIFQPQKPAAFNQAKAISQTDPVKVTLHDCLACSGCITSAETVMLEQQSVDEFLNQLAAGKRAVIVSLSPQSRASLAAYHGLTQLQVFKKLTGFFKSIGVKAVFDTSCSRDLSLIESCEEFLVRYNERYSQESGSQRDSLPMLASACPGWICYAEKTLDAEVLPHISSVKSPQQGMGAIIKRHIFHCMGILPEDIYHVTIMPCYDKKLEASRDDFVFAVERNSEKNQGALGPQITEVDIVLTSGEIVDLLKAKGIDFKALEEVPLDRMLTNINEEDHLYGVRGGSGGYAECIFRHASWKLFGQELPGSLEFKTLRNADFREVSLELNGKTMLRFACAYGFRNIQNLVRKIKAGKCEYHFVEIMACPAGCLNGGGQVKPKKDQSVKDLIQTLESLYLMEMQVQDPYKNPIAQGLYKEWLEKPGSAKALAVLHTGYHHREKNINSEYTNW